MVHSAEVNASEHWIEIGSHYVRRPDEAFDHAAVRRQIEKWAADNNISIQDISDSSAQPARFDQGRESLKPKGDLRQTVLEIVLESLDAKQLRATSLSLDVVATLLRKIV